jgi:hypothetical protein
VDFEKLVVCIGARLRVEPYRNVLSSSRITREPSTAFHSYKFTPHQRLANHERLWHRLFQRGAIGAVSNDQVFPVCVAIWPAWKGRVGEWHCKGVLDQVRGVHDFSAPVRLIFV